MTDLRYVVPLEFREDVQRDGPGRLTGAILPIGRVASDRREVFVPGSVTIPDGGIALLAEHRGREVMRVTPVERDGELRINAALPDTAIAREVAEDVRSGRRAGLSVEFHSLSEGVVQGVREIRAALITAAAIVRSGAYAQATVKVRAKGNHRRVLTWL